MKQIANDSNINLWDELLYNPLMHRNKKVIYFSLRITIDKPVHKV